MIIAVFVAGLAFAIVMERRSGSVPKEALKGAEAQRPVKALQCWFLLALISFLALYSASALMKYRIDEYALSGTTLTATTLTVIHTVQGWEPFEMIHASVIVFSYAFLQLYILKLAKQTRAI